MTVLSWRTEVTAHYIRYKVKHKHGLSDQQNVSISSLVITLDLLHSTPYSALYSVIIFYSAASCLEKNQFLYLLSVNTEHWARFKKYFLVLFGAKLKNMRCPGSAPEKLQSLTYDLSLLKHLACRRLFVTNCTSLETKGKIENQIYSGQWSAFNQQRTFVNIETIITFALQ